MMKLKYSVVKKPDLSYATHCKDIGKTTGVQLACRSDCKQQTGAAEFLEGIQQNNSGLNAVSEHQHNPKDILAIRQNARKEVTHWTT